MTLAPPQYKRLATTALRLSHHTNLISQPARLTRHFSTTRTSNMDYKPITATPTPLTFKGPAGKPGLPNMAGKRIVVVGGSGGVGSHLVDRYAQAGAHVIIASRTAQKGEAAAKAARDRNPGKDIVVAVGDTSSFKGAAAFAEKVSAEGQVDHVAIAVGGWWSGTTLWDAPEEVVDTFFTGVPTSYLANLKAWAHRLPKGHAIIWILGASGFVPVPGSGPVCMGSASLLMAQGVVERELQMSGAPFRLFSLVNGALNTRNRSAVHSSPNFPDADEIADLSLALMERQDATSHGLTLRNRDNLKLYADQLGLPLRR
jgi:NAD(P)-dependent dehydrogenase (short-subunit alcohol dehydrogenase family)